VKPSLLAELFALRVEVPVQHKSTTNNARVKRIPDSGMVGGGTQDTAVGPAVCVSRG